jgi:two-component system, cell cycle response regulator DivK
MMAQVLIIEDNASNMTLAKFLLESAGHTVLAATEAEAGLALASAELPDLILMDIQLPGMDGLEATALLKSTAATRDIPVIALTALAMKGDEERIRAAGCDGYIGKPLRYQSFLATIGAFLGFPAPGVVDITGGVNVSTAADAAIARAQEQG